MKFKYLYFMPASFLPGDFKWKTGTVSGTVYRYDDQLNKLLGQVYCAASYTNPLHPDVFTGICKLEAEIVRIACRLFHGDKNTCGTVSVSCRVFSFSMYYFPIAAQVT